MIEDKLVRCYAYLLSNMIWKNWMPKENPSCLIPFLLVVFTLQLEFLVTALAHLLSNIIWSFFKKIMTRVGQRPKLEELRLNKSGELEIMPTHVLQARIDLGQNLIMTNFLNERQRCKSLGGSGDMLPIRIFFISASQSPLSWVSESFRQDIGQFLLLGWSLATWKVFSLRLIYLLWKIWPISVK